MSKTTKRSVRKRVSKDGDLKALLSAERKARIENQTQLNNRVIVVARELSQVRVNLRILDANIRKLARVVGVPENSLQAIAEDSQEARNAGSDANANSAAGTGSSVG